ncbi:MAG: hypothetical protein LUF68_05900 [Clostridiales bacterium]|nr:hypothetical protein [Clostridiales bacterium]
MDTYDIALAIFFTVFAVIGLICTFLQKKGVIKPFLSQTSNSFQFVTTDGVTLLAIFFGAYMISRGSVVAAVLYAVILAGTFFLIKFSRKI